ncbi:hypothetical protein DFP73DRAFT_526054 [Morchella snyderi]|nr:hypothetical protein DFP73DRAFT_526054 [Morchella snyderi]
MDKEQVNPDDPTELVLVSQFQGAPVYRVVAKAKSAPESAATTKDNSQGIPEHRQLEMQDPIDDSSRAPPPPREPHPKTQVRTDADLDAGIIPTPIPPFPNITQGQAILGYTNSQWSFLYIRAQELVKPFAGRHAQTNNTPIHLRAENSVEILGPLLEEFPDLQRCEDNWGAKWIVRKARHAVSVKGASERRRSLKPSLKTKASSASVAESQEAVEKEKEEEREDDSEDDIEAAEDERRDNDSIIHSPVVGQVPVPDWHKYMTPKYTQGRGPSIYGLTKPITPFFEPTAGPPSMRHSSSDLDSSRSLATKRRGKRLPRPNPPSPSQASTTGEPVIINPDHPVMSGPTKHLSAVSSESSAVRRTVGFTIPKANRHMSTPVLSMSEDSPKEDDSHDPMQMDENEDQGISSRYPKAVSESPQTISADQGSAKHTMDHQYTDKPASETLVLPPIRGVLPDPDFGFDQENGDQSRMLPFSNGSRARPGFVNSFPRFDQLAGSSASDRDGKISIINRDPGPLMSPFNRDPYGTFGRGNTNNGAPNFQNGGQGGFNGAQGVPHAGHYHQESFYHNSGIYANGLPVNPYGFVMNQGQYYGGTAQGGPSLYAVAGPNGPGNNGHGITDPRNSVNTPLNIQPHPIYNHIAGNNNLYHQPSYDWNVQNLYGAASSGSDAIGNETARTNVDGAPPHSREVTPRVSRGKSGTRSRGQLRHASTWSGNPY